jgi:hypothetical protein
MKRGSGMDPFVLDPEAIAFHQIATFSQGALSLTEALQRSPLFDLRLWDRAAEAEWIQYTADDERSLFPFGRVSVHSQGILLETFNEERMEIFLDRVNNLGSWQVTPDQTRVLRVDDAMQRPSALLQPIPELEGRMLNRHDVAETYLRMAWPFLVREDLGHRAPHAVIQTGRGRAAVDRILAKLPQELRSGIPTFPTFEIEELRKILLPEEVPVRTEISEEKPHPADDRRRP